MYDWQEFFARRAWRISRSTPTSNLDVPGAIWLGHRLAGRKALHLDNLILTRQRHLLKGSCCEMVSPLENTAQWRQGRRIASNAIRESFVRWRFLNGPLGEFGALGAQGGEILEDGRRNRVSWLS